MESSQTRALLVLSAVLIAVVGVLYAQGEGEEPVDEDATAVIWEPVTAEGIVAVEIERDGERVVLERDDDGWWLRAPVEDRADGDAVRELLDDLREIERGIPVEVSAGQEADFGLGEPPEARVRVRLEDGSEQSVDVGIPAPVGYRTYMRSRDGRVAAVSGDPNETLQRRVQALRDHRLFRFDPAQVRRVRLEAPEGTLEVTGAGRRWWLEGASRADPDAVDDLVMGLLDLRFDVVLGLDEAVAEPVYRVVVELSDGQQHSAKTGRETPMGVLAMSGDGRVGAVYPESLALLGQGPTDLADPRAVPLDLERDDRVVIRRGAAEVEARRNGPAWESEGRDDGAVYDGLRALAEVPVLPRWSADTAVGPVDATVVVERDGVAQEVRLGGREGDLRRMIDAGGGGVYLVPGDPIEAALDALLAQPEAATP